MAARQRRKADSETLAYVARRLRELARPQTGTRPATAAEREAIIAKIEELKRLT